MTEFEILTLAFRTLKKSKKSLSAVDICSTMVDNGYCDMAVAPKPKLVEDTLSMHIDTAFKPFFRKDKAKFAISEYGSHYDVFFYPSASEVSAVSKSDAKKLSLMFKDRLLTFFDMISDLKVDTFEDVINHRIVPLIGFLGYDIYNPNEVMRTLYRVSGRASYSLFSGGVNTIDIECFSDNASLPKTARRSARADSVPNMIPKAIIHTNGNLFYVFRQEENSSYTLIASFCLKEANIDAFSDLLLVLSKSAFDIDSYKSVYIDEDVLKKAIATQVRTPSSALVELILDQAGIPVTKTSLVVCKRLIKQTLHTI